jgi:geranylgeranyl diphosphate synthase type II
MEWVVGFDLKSSDLEWLLAIKLDFEKHLKDYVKNLELEHAALGEKYFEALSYALTGEGKRVRPIFCLLSYGLFEEDYKRSLDAALALEMIHTYSLIHDDLPIMDNDDYRRGRFTVHKKYNELIALLVGDGLLSDAFGLLTGPNKDILPGHQALAVYYLSRAVGSFGMVLGQYRDLCLTNSASEVLAVKKTHELKTSKLIQASLVLGGVLAQGRIFPELEEIGKHLGFAFQLQDDYLDLFDSIGKTSGKDAEYGKDVYLKKLGADEVKNLFMKEYDLALLILDTSFSDSFAKKSLRAFIHKLRDRTM